MNFSWGPPTQRRMRLLRGFVTLIYTGTRVGVMSGLRMQDIRDKGDRRSLQLAGKEGKARDFPVRQDLDEWVAAYLKESGPTESPKSSPLFRAGERRSGPLPDRMMAPLAVQQMLTRRLVAARPAWRRKKVTVPFSTALSEC